MLDGFGVRAGFVHVVWLVSDCALNAGLSQAISTEVQCKNAQAGAHDGCTLWFPPHGPCHTGAVIERIGFGTGQVDPGTFRVRLAVGEPLTVGLGVTATSLAELAGATAFVWTNYGAADPRTFSALPMTPTAPTDAHQNAFTATLGPAAPGTVIVTAFVRAQGVSYWAPDYASPGTGGAAYGLANRLVFRVGDPAIAALNVRELPIDEANARSGSTDILLIEDLIDDQANWYTLQKLLDDGLGIGLQPNQIQAFQFERIA